MRGLERCYGTPPTPTNAHTDTLTPARTHTSAHRPNRGSWLTPTGDSESPCMAGCCRCHIRCVSGWCDPSAQPSPAGSQLAAHARPGPDLRLGQTQTGFFWDISSPPLSMAVNMNLFGELGRFGPRRIGWWFGEFASTNLSAIVGAVAGPDGVVFSKHYPDRERQL